MIYGIDSLYKQYKEDGGTLSKKEYKEVLKLINEHIVKLITYEGFDYKMPFGLGNICIYKKKRKLKLTKEGKINLNALPVDWYATKQLWKEDKEAMDNKILIRFKEDYLMKFLWDKRTCTTKNQNYFKFKLTKSNKGLVSKFIRENKDNLPYFDY